MPRTAVLQYMVPSAEVTQVVGVGGAAEGMILGVIEIAIAGGIPTGGEPTSAVSRCQVASVRRSAGTCRRRALPR